MDDFYYKVEELIESYPQDKAVALDIGCGNGFDTIKLLKKSSQVTGLDVENFVREEYRGYFKFVLGDGVTMPFRKSSFDLITCWEVIEHVKDPKQFLKEIFRILKPGGVLFLSTPNRLRLSNRLINLYKKIEYPYVLGKDKDVGDIVHLREYTLEDLTLLVKNAGFSVNKKEGVFLGFVRIGGFYKVPKILQGLTQHIFLSLSK
jgi:2-polyprenyl-3-methyl-5-hydroxy-6-metoxy-1,4-benzoquinol methylase